LRLSWDRSPEGAGTGFAAAAEDALRMTLVPSPRRSSTGAQMSLDEKTSLWPFASHRSILRKRNKDGINIWSMDMKMVNFPYPLIFIPILNPHLSVQCCTSLLGGDKSTQIAVLICTFKPSVVFDQ
jgi:hypothetical protein